MKKARAQEMGEKGKAGRPFSSRTDFVVQVWEHERTLGRALMWCVCELKNMCKYMCSVRAFSGFQKPEEEGRGVDERRLPAKQSISPSHRLHHTSQTHPSLLTRWHVSFIKQGFARASRVCVWERTTSCTRMCAFRCSGQSFLLPLRSSGEAGREWRMESEEEGNGQKEGGIIGAEWVSECERSQSSGG